MSFGGAAASMVASLKSNKRTRKKSFFEQDNKHEKGDFEELLKKKITLNQLIEVRKRIKNEKLKDFVKALVLLILISIAMYLVFKLFSSVDF